MSQTLARRLPIEVSLSAQVFGHRGHLQLGHLLCHCVHHRVVVGALAFVELLELRVQVAGELVCQPWQLG